ncbi:MAG TPA: cell division protein FtsZ [Allosphingosinicella sp.]
MIELEPELEELRPRISVIGVGGAGGNAVASMMRSAVAGVEFIVANTDAQALAASPAPRIVQLGRQTTQGLGAGSSADLGRAAAEESIAEVERALAGADMCFIAAGLGGGTGTGAAPVIARAARARGILTVGVVTRPFGFEGGRRARIAEAGLEALQQEVDTLIVIPNQNLFRVAQPETTFKQAFDLADEVLQQGVRGITDLMVMPGLINLDFADLRTIMAGMGKAMMGTGEAAGEGRAARAAQAAIANPLLDDPIEGARGLVISISGGDDMTLMEVDEAAGLIKAMVDPEADIIWGTAFDPSLTGRLRVSVVATGLDPQEQTVAAPAPVPVVDARQAAPAPEPEAAVVEEEPEAVLVLVEPAPPRPLSRPIRPALQPSGPAYPIAGPSLFDRMAGAARGAVARRKAEPVETLLAAE